MELTSARCLTNSISRFIHLATCITSNMPSQRDFRNVASCLKHLKPLLDNVLDNIIPTDDTVSKECEELDMAVNEARKFLEKWSPKMSKILCVLKSQQLLLAIQSSTLKIAYTLRELLESAPSTLSFPFPQHHVQEFQNLKLENASKLIEEALVCLSRGKIPHAEHICAIVELFALTLKYELLNEHIAVEKERVKAENNNLQRDSDKLNSMSDLISSIRDYMAKCGSSNVVKGVQIPSYFRCPLSLELMVDPVIVASGKTYDRTSINKWLDNGLILCPQTRQGLSHTNFIPNYTVKALIVNWCEENGIKLPKPNGSTSVLCQPEDFCQVSSKCFLQSNSSTLEAPCEVEKACKKEKNGSLESKVKELNLQPEKEAVRVANSYPEQSYSHRRTKSSSSAVSSIDNIPRGSTDDVSRISSKHDSVSDASGKITSDSHTSVIKYLKYSPLSARQYQSSKTLNEVAVNGKHDLSRGVSLHAESSSNDLTTTSHVEDVVKELKSQSTELQTSAAAELRFLAKNCMENRLIICQCGAITPLISLLYSDVKITQEHAVTALLNLSICEKIKAMIGEGGAIEPLIHVLKTGSPGARENAAASLFSLSFLEEYRIKIGRSGALKALVELLGSGSIRGKKDAATALFNLSIYHENKARIIQAGAVKHLVDLLDPAKEMVDKAIAVVANLSTISQGCLAIAREGGIPALVEIVETGSPRGKENASSALLQMCMNSPKYCQLILQEGAVPPLVALSQSGTPRAKEKAQQLLSHFRNQRECSAGRGGKS